MESKKATLLYVEDDENLGFVTTDNLEFNGYEVVHCKDGLEALEMIEKRAFDLCIFDVMLPKMDGFELAKILRKRNQEIPIIFLTAKSLKEDKIAGLKLGADDYLTKPFSIEELVLKIEIFLRRSHKTTIIANKIFSLGVLTFNFSEQVISGDQVTISLTAKEAELLKLFCEHPNKIIKREEILKSIWGDDDYFMGRSMDVFISRLRKYLKPSAEIVLENIHNVGFRLNMK